MQANKQQKMLRLVESGLMLSIATVLSMVKVLDLPYGGSITAFSALPILLVAYRHGTVQGLLTAAAHALIQLMLGGSALSYATSATAAVKASQAAAQADWVPLNSAPPKLVSLGGAYSLRSVTSAAFSAISRAYMLSRGGAMR